MHTHSCIKPGCTTQYEDTDPDAYYCPPCKAESKQIADEVDKRLQGRPRKETMSDLQAFDADPNKVRGFLRVQL